MAAIDININNFQEEVIHSDKPVLLDFWAPWCGPCRMVAPIVEEIAAENEAIAVGKVNVDDDGALAARFGITSIPTLILMEKGEAVKTLVGFRPKADILKNLGL